MSYGLIFSKMTLRSKISGMIVLIILSVATSFILFTLNNVAEALKFNLLIATLILSLLGVVVGIVLAERVTRPLKKLMYNVKAISNGRLEERVEIVSGGEIGELANAFDQMAIELDRRIKEITAGKEHLEDLLSKEQRMRQEVERSRRLSDIGEFAAAMAHEIRNPLARVLMGAYTLKDEPLNHERDEALCNILNGVGDLNRLVADLLNYTGKVELQKYMTKIWRVVDAAILNLKEEIEKGRIKVFRDIGPELPEVEIDAVKMERVFNNIIRNALQAMPDGGALAITASVNGLKLEVSFSDTGCGIPEELRDKIFDPFFTTKSEGTGLGLALVNRIIGAHGGSVKVESEKGSGSAFRVVLPVKMSVSDVMDKGLVNEE